VSLNCVCNYRVLKESPFRRVHIPPDPGDGGTSVGTALYYSASERGGSAEAHEYAAYQGPTAPESFDVEIVDFIDPERIVPYLKPGVAQSAGSKWRWKTFSDHRELSVSIADRLMRREIVGWVQGRAELGPRALGNRSILIRPDDIVLAKRLSKHVKERASLRPYAFSVTSRDALATLAIDAEHVRSNRWMQYAVPVRPEARERLAAALHVDGTSRPQVCYPEDNAAYHELLSAFGEKFGLGALLNTSFNPSGYPLVTTPVEAMAMFARTEMDALVLNNTVVWKDVEQA